MNTLRKPRIVHITSSSGGGTGKHVIDLLLGLHSLKRYELVLVYSSERADALFNEGLNKVSAAGLASIPFSVDRDINLFSDIKSFFQVYKILKNLNADILHVHAAKAALSVRIGKMFGLKGRVIYNPHGGVLHKFNEKLGFLYLLIEKMFIPFTDKYIAVSKYIENQLKNEMNIPKNKLIQIYNGISFDETKRKNTNFRSDGEELELLVVANFLEAKGHLILIEAINQYLQSEKRFFKFTFLGEGKLQKEIVEKIREYRLEEIIDLKGFVLNAADYYNECDAVIIPSVNDALPYAAIEAMYFAKPVFSTNVGGIPELVKEGITGHIFSVDQLKDMLDKLKYYKENRKNLRQLGENGRTAISKIISERKMVAEVNLLYESLLSEYVIKKDEIKHD